MTDIREPWQQFEDDEDDALTDAAWLDKHGFNESTDESVLVKVKDDKPEPKPAPVKREATEAEISEIYESSTSDVELHRRLREAGVPMAIDGMPLNSDGHVDIEAPQWDHGGKPLNNTAKARTPGFLAAEADAKAEYDLKVERSR